MFRLVCRSCETIILQRPFWSCSRQFSRTRKRGSPSISNLFRLKLRHARTPDAVQAPRLTPQIVTSILQMNEMEAQESVGAIKGYEANELQANQPIEDRCALARLVHSSGLLFGVFDGHAGGACAQTVSDRLFNYIAVAMADHDILHEIREGNIDPTVDLLYRTEMNESTFSKELAALHKKSLIHFVVESMAIDSSDTSIKDCLVNAFLRLDKDIATEALPSTWVQAGLNAACSQETLSIAFSGAVGCVAFIDGLDLLIANVGDSQAVLGVLNDNCWEAVPLSNKHNADNQSEIDRLLRSHPNESSNVMRSGRLFGDLIPLRAFGDVRYKWAKKDLKHLMNTAHTAKSHISIYGDNLIPRNYRTPPYLDAEPEIIHHRLTPKDKFLVLASDGLWDFLSPDRVVQLVAGHMDGKQVLTNYKPLKGATLRDIHQVLTQRKSSQQNISVDQNVATHLLRNALGPDHGRLSAQLTMPEKIVRFYRDDITIFVIYFDSDYVKDHAAPMHN